MWLSSSGVSGGCASPCYLPYRLHRPLSSLSQHRLMALDNSQYLDLTPFQGAWKLTPCKPPFAIISNNRGLALVDGRSRKVLYRLVDNQCRGVSVAVEGRSGSGLFIVQNSTIDVQKDYTLVYSCAERKVRIDDFSLLELLGVERTEMFCHVFMDARGSALALLVEGWVAVVAFDDLQNNIVLLTDKIWLGGRKFNKVRFISDQDLLLSDYRKGKDIIVNPFKKYMIEIGKEGKPIEGGVLMHKNEIFNVTQEDSGNLKIMKYTFNRNE